MEEGAVLFLLQIDSLFPFLNHPSSGLIVGRIKKNCFQVCSSGGGIVM